MERKMPASFYASMGPQQEKLKRMKRGEFTKWMTSLYSSAYDDGWNACVDAFNAGQQNGNIIVPEDVEAEVFDADALMDVLLSVKGIGRRRAEEVIRRIADAENI